MYYIFSKNTTFLLNSHKMICFPSLKSTKELKKKKTFLIKIYLIWWRTIQSLNQNWEYLGHFPKHDVLSNKNNTCFSTIIKAKGIKQQKLSDRRSKRSQVLVCVSKRNKCMNCLNLFHFGTKKQRIDSAKERKKKMI